MTKKTNVPAVQIPILIKFDNKFRMYKYFYLYFYLYFVFKINLYYNK